MDKFISFIAYSYLPYQILSVIGTILTFITIIFKDLIENFVRNNLILSTMILFLIICIFIVMFVFSKWAKNKLRAKAERHFDKAREYRNFHAVLPLLTIGESHKESDVKKYEEYMKIYFKNLELYLQVFLNWHIKPDTEADVKKLVEIRNRRYAEGVQNSDVYKHYLQILEKFENYCKSIDKGIIFEKVRRVELEKKIEEDKKERQRNQDRLLSHFPI